MYDKEILEEYSSHLQSYPWDIYFTVTTRQPWHVASNLAGKIWKTLDLFGGSRSFTAIESNFMVDRIHAHGLARIPDWQGFNQSSLWKYFFKQFGRTQVEGVREEGAVSNYCTKYIIKNNQKGDYFYFGDSLAWLHDSY